MGENASCKISGIIGITDNGYPIVTSDYVCPHWSEGADGFFMMHECWYCRYADFRKSSRIILQQSICRNPACRVAENIPLKVKNENQDKEPQKYFSLYSPLFCKKGLVAASSGHNKALLHIKSPSKQNLKSSA